jgi:hypothetical protein
MDARRLIAFAYLLPMAAQGQAAKMLSKPDAEFAEPFTSVAGVRELRDGRVVAIDVRDKVVQIVDFKQGSATKIGREGSGPGEYALPMRLLALPGDTSAVYDPLNSRMLLITPEGKPGAFTRIEQPAPGGGGGFVRAGLVAPRFTDAKGRIYWQGSGVQFRDGAPPVESDSAPILRYDRATAKADTVAFVRPPKGNVQASGGGGRVNMRIGGGNPFTPRDEWAVLADGRVAVLRSPEYRVDWYGTGGKKSGTPNAFEALKVTEKQKQLWRDSRKLQTAITMTIDNGNRRASAGPPPADLPEPTGWPDKLPPFLDNSAFATPNGMILVNRTRDADDETPNIDVLDASGKIVARYELPKNSRLVGTGNGAIYTVRTDADDLQYLQRYRIQ